MRLNSLYVNVDDMGRAIGFYGQFFRAAPAQQEERYSMFDAGGIMFGLFCARLDGEISRPGNNCIPNFEVDDVDAEYLRVRQFAPHADPQLGQVDAYRYFQCQDTEGNILEVYQIMPGF